MNVRLRRPPITVEKFLKMSDTKGYELVDGRLQEKAMGAEADRIQFKLGCRIEQHVEPLDLGIVFASECMYQCFPQKPDRVRKPDVSFIGKGRLPGNQIPEGCILIAPDFVIEVVSPQEKAAKLADKIADFESAKVPLIWIVYPKQRLVQVRITGGTLRELHADDELTGDPVLPGFRVKVADLFPPPAPADASAQS